MNNTKKVAEALPQIKISYLPNVYSKVEKTLEIDVSQFKDIIISNKSQAFLRENKDKGNVPLVCLCDFKSKRAKSSEALNCYGIYIDVDNNKLKKFKAEQLIKFFRKYNLNYILTESISSKKGWPKYHIFFFFDKPIPYSKDIDTKRTYVEILKYIFKDKYKAQKPNDEYNIDMVVNDIFSRKCFVSPKESFYDAFFDGKFIEADKILVKKSDISNENVISIDDKEFWQRVRKGSRNSHLAKSVGHEIGFGKSYSEIVRIALAWNKSLKNPMNEHEVMRTIDSIWENKKESQKDLELKKYDNLTDIVENLLSDTIDTVLEARNRDPKYVLIDKNIIEGDPIHYYSESGLVSSLADIAYNNGVNLTRKAIKKMISKSKIKVGFLVFMPDKPHGWIYIKDDERKNGKKELCFNIFERPPLLSKTKNNENIVLKDKCPTIFAIIQNLMADDGIRYHFLNWLATFYQTLKKSRISFVFRGVPGSGKSKLFEIITKIFGRKYCIELENENIESQFNELLGYKLFYDFNEVSLPNIESRKKIKNKLKALITQPTLNFNQKGVKQYTIKNYANSIFTSNEDQPIEIEANDRRYIVVDSRKKLENVLDLEEINLDDEIDKEINNFAQFLANFKINWHLYNTVLMTEEKAEIIDKSKPFKDKLCEFIINKDFESLEELLPLDYDRDLFHKIKTYITDGFVPIKYITSLFQMIKPGHRYSTSAIGVGKYLQNKYGLKTERRYVEINLVNKQVRGIIIP